MKMLKKIIALMLVAAMTVLLAACHKKDEVAVKVDGVEFTSAYYLCALINADSEARTKAQEAAEEDESIDTTKEDYYYSVKIEKKEYTTWVKDRALEMLKEIAAYKIKCKDAKVEMDDSTKSTYQYYAQYYWSSAGYSSLFEENGVSYSTYEQYMIDSAYSSLYFDHIYGEGGEKEISKEDLTKQMSENYALVNLVQVSYADLSDEEKTAKKTALEASVEELKNGKKDFETVYYEYNEKTEDESTDTTESTENAPQDSLATVVGKSETNYAFDKIDDVMSMAVKDVKLIDDSDNSTYYLIVKKDIVADAYYLTSMDGTLRSEVAGDDFDKDMEEYAKTLKAETVKYAVNQFDIKDIVYPESQS